MDTVVVGLTVRTPVTEVGVYPGYQARHVGVSTMSLQTGTWSYQQRTTCCRPGHQIVCLSLAGVRVVEDAAPHLS